MPYRSSGLNPRLAKLLRIVKPIVGIGLLGLVIVWISNNNRGLARISAAPFLYSMLISGLTIGLNAVILRISVACFGASVAYESALRLSALGTLGNALGGLPIGTALKYGLLYKHGGIRISEITAGFAMFSLATSGWLLVYASASAQFTPVPGWIKAIPPLLIFFGVAVLILVFRWSRQQARLAPLIEPFLLPLNLRRVLIVSLGVTTTFIANYALVGTLLYPDLSPGTLVLIASIGTFISLGSVLQSVGGATEVSLGLSSLLSGQDAATGVTLALVLRLTAIVAAGATLALLILRSRKRRDI